MSVEANETLPTPEELCRWLEAHGWVRDGEPEDRWIPYRHSGLRGLEIDVPRFYGSEGYKRHAVHAVELAAFRLLWRNLGAFMAALATVPLVLPPTGSGQEGG